MANKEMKTIQFPDSEDIFEVVDNKARQRIDNECVKVTVQDLTEEQKNQVKSNLGLAPDVVPLSTYATGSGGLVQVDANVILDNYDNFEGNLILFYANEQQPVKLVSVGMVMRTFSDDPVLIEIDRDGLISKWTTTTNYVTNGEFEKGINYSLTKVPSKVNVTTSQANMMKGLRVWYDFQINGETKNTCDDIRFTSKSSATKYVTKPLPAIQKIVDTNVYLQYDKATGVLEVLRVDGQETSATTKIVDVKGIK